MVPPEAGASAHAAAPQARAELEPLALSLLSSCCKIAENREAALRLQAVDTLLLRAAALMAAPSSSSGDDGGAALLDALLSVAATLVAHAQRASSAADADAAAAASPAWAAPPSAAAAAAEEGEGAAEAARLETLLECVGLPGVRARPAQLEALAPPPSY